MKKTAIIFLVAFILTVFLSLSSSPAPVSKGENQPPPPPELTVEEYKLAVDAEELLKDQDCINLGCVPEQILGRRKKWRDSDPIDRINEQLKSLRYSFNKYKDKYGGYLYSLYQGSRLLYTNLRQVRGFSLNGTKTKFIFVADYNLKNKIRTCIFEGGKITDCTPYLYPYHIPYFWNDRVIRIETLKNVPHPEKFRYAGMEISRKRYQIRSAEKPIYTVDILDYPFDFSIQQFYTYEQHWVLEYMEAKFFQKFLMDYYGTVVVDGINLNKKFGQQEVFNYIYLRGKPFYFFRSPSGFIKLFYGGQVLPHIYDDVIHYACCSQAALNPKGNEHMISFFAYKGGSLYYVEAGVYN